MRDNQSTNDRAWSKMKMEHKQAIGAGCACTSQQGQSSARWLLVLCPAVEKCCFLLSRAAWGVTGQRGGPQPRVKMFSELLWCDPLNQVASCASGLLLGQPLVTYTNQVVSRGFSRKTWEYVWHRWDVSTCVWEIQSPYGLEVVSCISVQCQMCLPGFGRVRCGLWEVLHELWYVFALISATCSTTDTRPQHQPQSSAVCRPTVYIPLVLSLLAILLVVWLLVSRFMKLRS